MSKKFRAVWMVVSLILVIGGFVLVVFGAF